MQRWIRTRDVVVEEKAIPHSHPVLTLNTQYLKNDNALLATFIHEQFHWLEAGLLSQEPADDEICNLPPYSSPHQP